jgi:hypothetical protein
MSREELEKEVRLYLRENFNSEYYSDIEMIIGFAEPRENHIEILKKENTELREKLECTEKARDYWKNSSFDWRHKCTSRKPFKVAVKAQKQLSKAEKIIKELLDFDFLPDVDVKKQAEQFLKEIEE